MESDIILNTFNNVTVEQKAVGEITGEVQLQVPATNNDRTSRELFLVEGTNTVDIQMVSLDDYFSEQKVDFIKIDTEGFEPEVIEGAVQLIRRSHPVLLLEYSPMFYKKRGITGEDMLETLVSEGYELKDIDANYGVIKDVQEYTAFILNQGGGISNLLATHQKSF